MISWTFDIKKKPFVDHPNLLWNEGLKDAGAGWSSEMKKYPPSQSSYRRTHTMGDKANFNITSEGTSMDLTGVFYTKYVLFGTGIFGARGQPITPVSASMLSWVGPGGVRVFAKSVKGFIWAGKLDLVKQAIINGFKRGLQRALK